MLLPGGQPSDAGSTNYRSSSQFRLNGAYTLSRHVELAQLVTFLAIFAASVPLTVVFHGQRMFACRLPACVPWHQSEKRRMTTLVFERRSSPKRRGVPVWAGRWECAAETIKTCFSRRCIGRPDHSA